jgi:hypothetical protein
MKRLSAITLFVAILAAWEQQAGGKFKLHFVGTVTDVLSGKVGL